jgi:hypothetical protein
MVKLFEEIAQTWVDILKKKKKNIKIKSGLSLLTSDILKKNVDYTLIDAYNFKHNSLPLVVLDSYGDHSFWTINEYNEQPKKLRPSLSTIRLGVMLSAVLITANENFIYFGLISIYEDFTYLVQSSHYSIISIPEYFSYEQVFGNKAAYSLKSPNILSLRLKNNDSLQDIEFSQDPDSIEDNYIKRVLVRI